MIKACVFDAYGTLFDVTAAARRAAQEPAFEMLADVWANLADDWRLKQLQYTWLRAITQQHCDFWQVTQDGLDFALEKHGLLEEPKLRKRLLDLYWELEAYDEVPSMLGSLKSEGQTCAILSNGSPDMLAAAITSAGLTTQLDDVLSVEDVGVFKPDARVYQMVCSQYNCTPSDVLFVSSNGWDAAGAAGFGFKTVWVNRANDPQDRLSDTPTHVRSDLRDIPTIVSQLNR